MPICNCALMVRALALSSAATWLCQAHGRCGATLTEWLTENCPGCGAITIIIPQRHSSRAVHVLRGEPCPSCRVPSLTG